MEFHDSFALLKWKIESVTLAPLLTPEDTKKQGLETVWFRHSFSTHVEKSVNISPFFIEVVLHG